MILALTLVALVVVLSAAYRVRAAWSPYGTHGRRRAIHWFRGWWRGDNAVARNEE